MLHNIKIKTTDSPIPEYNTLNIDALSYSIRDASQFNKYINPDDEMYIPIIQYMIILLFTIFNMLISHGKFQFHY